MTRTRRTGTRTASRSGKWTLQDARARFSVDLLQDSALRDIKIDRIPTRSRVRKSRAVRRRDLGHIVVDRNKGTFHRRNVKICDKFKIRTTEGGSLFAETNDGVREMASARAGRWMQQPTGYKAFVPASLPPRPPLRLSGELTRLLSEADRSIGRLDGISAILPNPKLFIAMYVRQEAVLSSQIEGTQSTLEDVLAFEAEGDGAAAPKDVAEVVNYVAAMQTGLARLSELPLSLRLIREIHTILMKGVRGAEKRPGEFRTSQNWIGAKGCQLGDAEFVPPPPHEMSVALGELETFLHDTTLPALLHAGLAHAQFETIHPFLDGNGRVGRLLITFLLCGRRVLRHPLLYLSVYLKAHRAQYYDRLTAIRNDGDWEGWIGFFLRGVGETSDDATATAHAIVRLREELRARELPPAAARLRDLLFEHPILTARSAESLLNVQYATANRALDALADAGIVREVTGQQRNRRFRFDAFLSLFDGARKPND